MIRETLIALRLTVVTLVLTGPRLSAGCHRTGPGPVFASGRRQPGERRPGKRRRLVADRPAVCLSRLFSAATVGGRQRLRSGQASSGVEPGPDFAETARSAGGRRRAFEKGKPRCQAADPGGAGHGLGQRLRPAHFAGVGRLASAAHCQGPADTLRWSGCFASLKAIPKAGTSASWANRGLTCCC